MQGDWSGPIAALAGIVSALGIYRCYASTKRYRKASRLLGMAKKKQLQNVTEAVQQVNLTKDKEYGFVQGFVKSFNNTNVVFTESRPYSYSLRRMQNVENDRGILVSASKFALTEPGSSVPILPILPYSRTQSLGIHGTMRPESWVMGVIGLLVDLCLHGQELLDFRFGYNDYTVSAGDNVIVFGTLEHSSNEGGAMMSKALYICGSSRKDIIERISNFASSLKWKAIGSAVLTGICIGAFACATYWAYSRWKQRRQAVQLLAGPDHEAGVVRVNDVRCAICKLNPRTITFKPCGHLAVCERCQDQRQLAACPICHQPSTEISKIFVA
jgi:hypothetical protein